MAKYQNQIYYSSLHEIDPFYAMIDELLYNVPHLPAPAPDVKYCAYSQNLLYYQLSLKEAISYFKEEVHIWSKVCLKFILYLK